jgi:asparagine synthase (glutamine-hydrolysing)
MRDAGQREIRAITLAFDEFRGTSEDEAPLAARTCEYYGAHHIVRRLSEQEFVEDLPAIFEAMDQPSIDGVNTWFVSKAAKEAGLKVAISGLGGDELLGGYPSSVDLPRWHRRFGPLAAVPGVGFFARKLIAAVAPAFSRVMPKALGVLEYSGSWAGTYLLRRGLFLPHELSEVMDAEIAREGLRRLKPLRRLAANLTPDPISDNARVCVLESAQYMRNQLLRDADWVGMAHSLEIRVPLVDFILLRALAPVIPALTPGAGKAALANSPTIPLPKEIVTRAKTGFNVPTGDWINAAIGRGSDAVGRASEAKGLVSRRWSRAVLNGMASANAQPQVRAS